MTARPGFFVRFFTRRQPMADLPDGFHTPDGPAPLLVLVGPHAASLAVRLADGTFHVTPLAFDLGERLRGVLADLDVDSREVVLALFPGGEFKVGAMVAGRDEAELLLEQGQHAQAQETIRDAFLRAVASERFRMN